MPNNLIPNIRELFELAELESCVTIDNEKHLIFKLAGIFWSVNICKTDLKEERNKKESEVREYKQKVKDKIQRIFDRFDQYSCIKDDDWYKKLKEEELNLD